MAPEPEKQHPVTHPGSPVGPGLLMGAVSMPGGSGAKRRVRVPGSPSGLDTARALLEGDRARFRRHALAGIPMLTAHPPGHSS